jgi:hypothetical protein
VNRHVDRGAGLVLHLQAAQLLEVRAMRDLAQRIGQPGADTRPGHDMDVPIRLPRRRFEVAPGSAVDVEDVAAVIDQHGRRRELLQNHLIDQCL